jgi:hypothetical protein
MDEEIMISRKRASFKRFVCGVISLTWYLLTSNATAIIMKINRVLTDNKLAKTSRLEKKAMRALEMVIRSVAFIGVPVFGWTRANHGGIMWARAI